jgi:hypothetical protein
MRFRSIARELPARVVTTEAAAAGEREASAAHPSGGEPGALRQMPHLGGDALSTQVPRIRPAETGGLVLVLLILLAMSGSFVAAGLPMLVALPGAATTLSAIYLATALTQVMSPAPGFALMLGLAAGIGSALFVVARHRDQLDAGALGVAGSVARATATAGPFLTTMGLAAAGGAGVAVAVSLTALPALLMLAGERLRPQHPRHLGRRAGRLRGPGGIRLPAGASPSAWWVRTVTARPLVTTGIVVAGLALCALPAKGLLLSVPDGDSLDRGLTSRVTGTTAAMIDLSGRLGRGLLPFGLLVAGLCFALLAAVYRSLAVPLSAVLGCLLSAGAAFGVTSMVWMHGWLGVQHAGSVTAFLPILVIGALFGLAMDYQIFVVSRMREHYVRHQDARAAVAEGFAASARNVTAAALIMLAVFVSFVRQGTADTKPLAFSLAAGVLLDVFAIRMTLVPAVLTLLGDRAWRLPAWADRRLPAVDAEGDRFSRQLRLPGAAGGHGGDAAGGSPGEDAPGRPGGGALTAEVPVVAARALSVRDDTGRPVVDGVTCTLRAGAALVVAGPSATALLLTLGGRVAALGGDLVVCGQVLPDRRRAVRRTIALVLREVPDAAGAALSALDRGVPLLILDGAEALPAQQRAILRARLRTALAGPGPRPGVVLGCDSWESATSWLASLPGASYLEAGLPGPRPGPGSAPAFDAFFPPSGVLPVNRRDFS